MPRYPTSNQSLGEELIDAAREARDIAQGKKKAAKEVVVLTKKKESKDRKIYLLNRLFKYFRK